MFVKQGWSRVKFILFRLFPLPVIFMVCPLSAEDLTSRHKKEQLPPATAHCDTVYSSGQTKSIRLGSRFIIPGSLRLYSGGQPVAENFFRLEPVPGVLHPDSILPGTRLVAFYSAWDFLTLPDSFRLRPGFADSLKFLAREADTVRPAPGIPGESLKTGGIGEGFRLVGFEIKGSKSVSVTGGGRGGNTVLDQNLMLEVSGKLSADTRLTLQLNDQDLPLMAEGRSTELRQLDEIKVTLTNPSGSVSLGDYDFRLGPYRFASLERKLDGVSGVFRKGPASFGASAALSVGTYHSMRFMGREGSQGPYQLLGENSEPVRVLAGTERVYLDGTFLKRGLNNDYIIDYNLGNIIFTDRHLIGSDSRIEVDYEYSSFTYKKALYSLTGETKGSLGSIRGYFFRQSDLEDSPLAGNLTPEERDYLSRIGMNPDSLLLGGIRRVGEGRGSYRLRFTSDNRIYFEYAGSGNGDYLVVFHEAGSFLGSYIFDPSTGGYRYLGPNLGDFEPAGEFTPPSREDRAGLSFELAPWSHLRVEGEGGLLKNTMNLYSGASQPLKTAHHLFFYLDTLGFAGFPGRLSVHGGETRVQNGFTFQGRRHEPDFERRWNLLPQSEGLESTAYGERIRELGSKLYVAGGLEMGAGYGQLLRTNGERANRRDYSVYLHPREGLTASWQRLSAHAARLPGSLTSTGLPAPSYRLRDNAEASLNWKIFTPRFTLEREESQGAGIYADTPGRRYLEIGQRLTAKFSPRFETGFSFLSRGTDYLTFSPDSGSLTGWVPNSNFRVGQIDFRYQGKGALRLNGRLGHRTRRYESKALSRSSSTAGRIELLSGSFSGALQSHLVYEISHGSSLRTRVVYLPERYPDQGEYLENGTYVGKAQGTHIREILPADIDPRETATLNLTARENLDLTRWIDSSGTVIKRMALALTMQLERESTMDKNWKLYLLMPSALNDQAFSLFKGTRINTDLTVQWADPAVFTRVELVWNTSFDRRFENGLEGFGDKAIRFQVRVPLRENLEWDPTAAINRRSRQDLAGGSRKARIYELENRLIVNFNNDWRGFMNLNTSRYMVPERDAKYFKTGYGLGLSRFLAGSGRIEAGINLNNIRGTKGEDILLVDLLGSAKPGTSLEATAAVSVEPGERMLLHFRYTGRTDYLLNRFTNYGSAELKYFF